ncbi:helix-turn-helix transcriptional regulator [Spirosoma sp.]|uniref:helix-turn-helix domain-containing protein n=1 Tax=Spirosoma sp. TaxID=1899569 RepID=UPI00262A4D9E|nr:helix-turn-helix transcriptional regulator [Spirosoma sp.]MCX6215824.1 helix-turn-helix transcriptional regulator [Spirosoma sp.]
MLPTYREIATRQPYQDTIQKFWILDHGFNPVSSSPQCAIPNGCCTLALISGNGVSLTFAEKPIHLAAGIYLSGQITQKVSIVMKPYSKAIMVQLKPWVPSMMTNAPINWFTNDVVSLELVNSPLYQTMANLKGVDETIVIDQVYDAFAGSLHPNTDTHFIQWTFNHLQKGLINQETIADLVRRSGYSQRRMEQLFRRLIGPTAKEMQRILQLRQVVSDLHHREQITTLGELAYRHGYYDQAHFTRAYQRVLGELPSAFRSQNYLLPVTPHFDFLQL